MTINLKCDFPVYVAWVGRKKEASFIRRKPQIRVSKHIWPTSSARICVGPECVTATVHHKVDISELISM